MKAYLLGEKELTEVAPIHQAWAQQILTIERDEIQATTIDHIMNQQLTAKFQRVLEDAGVYKLDEAGRAGFMRFIESLNA